MKKLLTIAATVAFLFGMSTATVAQERDYTSAHNFVGVQVGGQATLTHYSIGDLITPQFAVQAGRYFNDKVGARLHLMGYQNKGGFQTSRFPFLTEDTGYKFNAATFGADLLVNMTNLINPNRECRKLDWILLTGFGVNYTWDYDEFNTVIEKSNQGNYYTGQLLGESKRNSFHGRLGTQVNYNINDDFTVGLELQANYKNDCYNLKYNGRCDWQVAALVGLTYNFGYKTKAKSVVVEPEPVVVEPEPAPAPVVVEEPAPVVVKEEPLKETIFYQIRLSDPSEAEATLNKVIAWCEKYPSKNITISGYADKGTGNEEVNKKYAHLRATRVADSLREKGLAVDRMIVDSYGDTVQPFAENDLNRCVIIVGE